MALALTLVLAPEQYQASYRFRIFECGTVCPPYAPFTSEAFEYFVPEAIVQPTVNPSHWTTNGCKFVNGIPPELSRFAEAECRVISMPKAVPAGIDYEIELCFLMKSLTFSTSPTW
ncbi:uncharacterized protein L969DRAFT_85625 [Mixia osmundae IAM 14324]|uniref:uncharacterized protein n=1 Tax=Mixia osmundae (strain CBS 9802 / IAM 14324 / JCM 22182 / KY 12970) TaxID=764103 RepID=UPI0004A54BBA|nr:uncharacterized protein L969DRAFT_85625 [Mixia osmundae IAM 14324]KEI40464.1 hypothetical protein L969DRAFT_85625 [Mixia osmundae IAM 14324]